MFNFFLAADSGWMDFSNLYVWLLMLQVLFYLMVLIGWVLENKELKSKLFFIPYYFFIMNYAVVLGINRYFKGQQSVNWERAKRGS
ncbi:MAG: hypothetical protein WC341_10195, partial [Bacteroidales bacterium]|jgi:hypothetical protein